MGYFQCVDVVDGVQVYGSRVGIHYGLRPAGCGLPTSAGPEEFTPDCSAELIGLNEGFPNVSFALGAQSTLAVELFDHLSLSYGLGVRSYFKYAMVNDSFTSGNAQTGRAQRHYFNPSWTLSYPLSRKIELPVELSVFLDASAFQVLYVQTGGAYLFPQFSILLENWQQTVTLA